MNKLIDAKQRLRKGLMQQLLTGRIRFPKFGEPTLKKGTLPGRWIASKLGNCFKERKETNPELLLLSITSERGVILRDEVDRKDSSNADKSKYKRIVPGDIGYNTMRMWQGVSAVSALEGIVSPAYTICSPKKGNNSLFFGYLFKYPQVINLFFRFSQGLVSDTLNLKFRHFSQIKVKIPFEPEQIRIAEVLSACDREIELLRDKQEAIRKQKKGLMQKLLTGEVRVKV
ncbi:MAG: restriction endonuclease subunit S [Planctomycetota bacterium]|nr:restriction endonuclease subunit S [Planctomycetota bacterium]